jgi:oligoribonuclease
MARDKKPPSRYLVWVDLETTGLDPGECAIAEVAVVIANENLREIEAYSTPVHVHGMYLDSMDPFVRGMHVQSGLIHELAGAPYADQVQAKLVDLLKAYTDTDREKPPLCGSSVHFDRAFLKCHMPKFEACLSYRHVDISSFKECARRWSPRACEGIFVDAEVHRALPDVRTSLQHLRDFAEEFYWPGGRAK